MAKAFKYGLKGITGFLEPAERELLRSLIDDVISMLQPEERENQDPLAALIGLDMDVREPSDRAVKRTPGIAVKRCACTLPSAPQPMIPILMSRLSLN